MRRLVVLSIVVLMATMAFCREVTREARGSGETRRLAIREALAIAVQQQTGVVLTTEEAAQFAEEATMRTNSRTESVSEQRASDSLNRDLRVKSSGRITGFDVLSEERDAITGDWTVQLLVRFPDQYVVGLDPDNRRRMAVVDFRPYGNTFSWYGQEASSVEWVKALSDKLNVRLTKTRRFSMLERKFTDEINDELAGLKDENIAPRDLIRRCQKLATDYLMVGEVRFYPVSAPAINPLTGKAMPRGSQLFAEVTYRVVLAPTAQLKFTDIIKVDAASVSAGSVGEFTSKTTDMVASLIVDGIMANYCQRDESVDGTEGAETAVETMNVTPVPEVVVPVQPTTIRGNGTGGVVTPF